MFRPVDYYITPEEYKIAEKNGISKCTLERRIRLYGWDKQRALTQKPHKRHDRSYWMNVAKENGIKKSTFLGRVNRHGWSEEKAATTVVVKTAIRNRKYSDKVYKRLEENGISRQLFYDRIRKGWDIERATTRKPFTNQEKAESLKNKNSYFKDLNELHWAISKSKCHV
ncbi:hypothetical protein [Clostridium sardiniense]|uniref:hypothetical protein n=1 Tax=Clostridium sardiniense TaxID=29369 RepID=UPI00195A43BE|nr:hypothetical protein [Clostridium sardiniense]MBM7836424.1 DNA invertase Pin-like site-specific DNA recombinase [Clostridium sardiniense]